MVLYNKKNILRIQPPKSIFICTPVTSDLSTMWQRRLRGPFGASRKPVLISVPQGTARTYTQVRPPPPTNIRPLPQVWNRIIKSVVILPLEYKYIYSCNDTARTRCCERNYNNHNAVSISLLPMIAPARPAADEMSCHTRHLHCNHRSHKPVFAMPIHKIMKLMTRSSAKRTSFMVDEFHKLLADFEWIHFHSWN